MWLPWIWRYFVVYKIPVQIKFGYKGLKNSSIQKSFLRWAGMMSVYWGTCGANLGYYRINLKDYCQNRSKTQHRWSYLFICRAQGNWKILVFLRIFPIRKHFCNHLKKKIVWMRAPQKIYLFNVNLALFYYILRLPLWYDVLY